MKWLNAIVRETVGLFVDSGSFASAIVGWLVLVFFLSRLDQTLLLGGGILLVGLLVILVGSTVRFARNAASATRSSPPS